MPLLRVAFGAGQTVPYVDARFGRGSTIPRLFILEEFQPRTTKKNHEGEKKCCLYDTTR